MKTFITLLLICISAASFAQMHFTIPVQELDTVVAAHDSSSFRMHPIQLDIDVNIDTLRTATTPTIYGLNVTTLYYENIANALFYKAKNSTTMSTLEVPETVMDLPSTINPDKSYNIAKLNPILAMFGLMYRSKPVTGVNTKLY